VVSVSEKEVEVKTPAETKQRPRPKELSQLVIIWFVVGIYNLYVSLSNAKADLKVFSRLSAFPEWVRIGVPVEFALNASVFVVSLIAIIVIYGLWTGKSWSRKSALTIPLSITVCNILAIVLYYSAPIEIQAYINMPFLWGVTLFSLFATIMSWRYLKSAEVKEFLSSRTFRLRDIAIVMFLLVVCLGSILVVQTFTEKLETPNFIVINVDKTWNTDETQITYRIEVQNLGGDGWMTLHLRYNETDQTTGTKWTETKQWQVQLDNEETKIITLTFNRHSMNAISYNADFWFTY
jgi:hypothetical protein